MKGFFVVLFFLLGALIDLVSIGMALSNAPQLSAMIPLVIGSMLMFSSLFIYAHQS